MPEPFNFWRLADIAIAEPKEPAQRPAEGVEAKVPVEPKVRTEKRAKGSK